MFTQQLAIVWAAGGYDQPATVKLDMGNIRHLQHTSSL